MARDQVDTQTKAVSGTSARNPRAILDIATVSVVHNEACTLP